MGTIFAVYEAKGGTDAGVDDVLRAGIDLKVAGYCMYVVDVVGWLKLIFSIHQCGSFIHPTQVL